MERAHDEQKVVTLIGQAKYKLILLRGRLTHLKPFLLDGDPEAVREYGTLVRFETQLLEVLQRITQHRMDG